jgi:type II secretory pathway component PulF
MTSITDFLKKYWWMLLIVVYVVIGVIVGIALQSNGLERPILGSILWPIRLLKLLLGGG